MPQLPQKLDTTANQLAKNYSPASTVKIAPVADTTVVATDIRTVVTRSTQGTLELQRNEELCKAEYINLCVIRELEPLLPAFLEPYCGVGVPGVFASDNRLYGEQLLKRVLNQNEQAHGLFYLHPDADAGIDTASVALLRVSIALRREHLSVQSGCDQNSRRSGARSVFPVRFCHAREVGIPA